MFRSANLGPDEQLCASPKDQQRGSELMINCIPGNGQLDVTSNYIPIYRCLLCLKRKKHMFIHLFQCCPIFSWDFAVRVVSQWGSFGPRLVVQLGTDSSLTCSVDPKGRKIRRSRKWERLHQGSSRKHI